jgi:hypothetical protein
MRWVVANIHRIMILSGLLAMTMSYAALAPEEALRFGGASKRFSSRVLWHGGRFLGYQAGIAVFVDVLWVIVFASYLLAVRCAPTGDARVAATVTTV